MVTTAVAPIPVTAKLDHAPSALIRRLSRRLRYRLGSRDLNSYRFLKHAGSAGTYYLEEDGVMVEKARANNEAIVLERLKGIRDAHQKGNGEGTARRRRIALWPFRQLQSYIEYKARWAGVPVWSTSLPRTPRRPATSAGTSTTS